jgi:uncharacterized protein YbaP (TraB family)
MTRRYRFLISCLAAQLVAAPAFAKKSDDKATPIAAAMVKKAVGQLQSVQLRSRAVFRMLLQARNGTSKRRIHCLDSALNQAHAIERLANTTVTALSEALKDNDGKGAALEGQRMNALHTQSQQVWYGAGSCR